MSSFDRAVCLLSLTDGRDKLAKSLLGVFRILASLAERTNDPHAKGYHDIVASIGSARSLMRMGKFVADLTKVRALLELFAAQGIIHTENKKFVEFFRVICNSLYVVFDNIAFLCRYNVLDVCTVLDGRACLRRSQRAQLAGYVLSFLCNTYELRDGLLRLEYDPPAARRACTKAAVSLIRDSADALATAPLVGVGANYWHPSEMTVGSLLLLSGSLSTYLNWKKIK